MIDHVLTQLEELDAQRAELLDGAKQEALEEANAAVEKLNQLGFDYVVIPASELPKRRKAKAAVSDKPCSICGFKTEPSHDARLHRSQGDNKRPFTDEELAERNMARVADPVELPDAAE